MGKLSQAIDYYQNPYYILTQQSYIREFPEWS